MNHDELLRIIEQSAKDGVTSPGYYVFQNSSGSISNRRKSALITGI
jgi:hypothetical protein